MTRLFQKRNRIPTKKLLVIVFTVLFVFVGMLSPISVDFKLQNDDTSFHAVSVSVNMLVAQAEEKCGYLDLCFYAAAFIEALEDFVDLVGWLMLQISGFALYLGGIVLNFSFMYTVVNFATNIRGVEAINIAWTAFRDLANIIFIFVFLFIAIATILRISNWELRKAIAPLIIAALFVNFSLFFTKFVIDVSNIVAIQFFNAIALEGATIETLEAGTVGISDAFMRPLKLTEIYTAIPENPGRAGKTFMFAFTGSIFNVVAAFVFFSGAIMLVIRFVALIIIMILSPLAFVAFAIPGTKKYFSMWFESLTKHAFYATFFMMLTWVVVRIINAPAFGGDESDSGDAFNALMHGNSDAVSILFNFVVTIALILAIIIVSQKLSLHGAQAATKYGGRATGKLFAAGAATAGFAGRRGIGGTASWAERRYGTRLAERSAKGGRVGKLADVGLKTLEGAQNRSYDVRGIRGVRRAVGSIPGEAGKGAAAGLGAPSKEAREGFAGFKKRTAEKQAARVARAGKVRPPQKIEISETEKIRREQENVEDRKIKAQSEEELHSVNESIQRVNVAISQTPLKNTERRQQLGGQQEILQRQKADLQATLNRVASRGTERLRQDTEAAQKEAETRARERKAGAIETILEKPTIYKQITGTVHSDKEMAAKLREEVAKEIRAKEREERRALVDILQERDLRRRATEPSGSQGGGNQSSGGGTPAQPSQNPSQMTPTNTNVTFSKTKTSSGQKQNESSPGYRGGKPNVTFRNLRQKTEGEEGEENK